MSTVLSGRALRTYLSRAVSGREKLLNQ
jgi:hypothetical protein